MLKRFLLTLFLFIFNCVSSPFIEQKEQDILDQVVNYKSLHITNFEEIEIKSDGFIYKEKKYPFSYFSSLTISDQKASGKMIISLAEKMTLLTELDISKTATSVREICEIIKITNCCSLTLSEKFFLIKFNDPDIVLNLKHLTVVTPYRSTRPERLFCKFSDIVSTFVRLTNAGNRLPSLETFCLEVVYSEDEVSLQNEAKKALYPDAPPFKKQRLNKKAKQIIETAQQLSLNLEIISIKESIYRSKFNNKTITSNVYYSEKTLDQKEQNSISGAG